MEGYQTEIIRIPALRASTLMSMCEIYLAHYDSCDESLFKADLEQKSEALLVYKNRALVGFSLYEIYRDTWRDNPIRIIFSGDTIVDRAHWGQQALAFSWISRIGQLKRQEPDTPLYWFLIVKGHRTYRYLPTFSHSFHPHWIKTSADLKALADRLAVKKFGEAYQPDTGVIAFPQSRGHLKAAYAHPTARELTKDSVKFFLQQNPGYLEGQELVCVCELCESNLKPLARRLFNGQHR